MPAQIPGSDLTIERAVAGDPRVETFYFGAEPWAVEVEEEFKSGVWEDDRDLWLFLLNDDLVAGARLGFWNRDPPHLDVSDVSRRKYFLILSFGVNVPFQKQPDPGSDPETTFARSILAYIESKGRANASCIGLSLWVRADNERARAMYEALGFGYDPSGPFDDDGLETYEMRKWFAA
jgi:RimJ/RimL family protein N-acetyltransferase